MNLIDVIFALAIPASVVGAPIEAQCHATEGSGFMADDTDPCVFYWCMGGNFVFNGPLPCAGGSAVVPGYSGPTNPCIIRDSAHCMRKYGVLKEGTDDVDEAEKSAPWWAVQEPDQYYVQYAYAPQPYQYPNHNDQQSTDNPATTMPPTTPTTAAPLPMAVYGYGYPSHGQYVHLPQPYPYPVHVVSNTLAPPETTTTTTPAPVTPKPASMPMAYGSGHNGGYSSGATAFLTPNAHLPNGTYISYVNSLKKCWRACVFSLTCKGFDFNHHYGTCYLHDDNTVCRPLVSKEACTNYRLVHCPTTFAPPSDPTPRPTTPMPTKDTTTCTEFDKMHIFDGYLQGGISTKDACIAACMASTSCAGIDFDSHGNTCWFHTSSTECNALVSKATSLHCRLQPDTCNTVLNPMAAIVDAHAKGGVRQTSVTDANTCFAMCTGDCIAIDFDMKDNTCWHHTAATCGKLFRAYSVLHLLRTTCPHSSSSSSYP